MTSLLVPNIAGYVSAFFTTLSQVWLLSIHATLYLHLRGSPTLTNRPIEAAAFD
jgi:hypothetical protein